MESPSGNRIPATSSPAVKESPFFNYLLTLSPIERIEAARNPQRFSEPNLPTPPPVFTSPHIDLHRESRFLKRYEKDAANLDGYGEVDTQGKAVQIPCFQKDVQSSSPSVCVDEYISDPLEVDESTKSAELPPQSSIDEPQLFKSDYTDNKKGMTKIGEAMDSNMNAGMLKLLDQIERDPRLSSVNLVETTVDQKAGQKFKTAVEFTSGKVNDPVDSNMFLGSISQLVHHGQYMAQTAVDGHNKQDSNCQSFPASSQSVEGYEDCSEIPLPLSNESVKDANQHQHDIRRHLQFEAANISCDMTHDTVNPELSDNLMDFESLFPSFERRGSSSSWQAGSCPQPINSWSSLYPTGLISSAQKDDDQQESQAVRADNSATSQSTNDMKPSCDSLHGTLVPCDGGVVSIVQDINRVERLNNASPRKKRKKAADISENDGCKRCNCKRSKCLKLYCECFAAGVYCLDSCACENCFNKPDYEDTVLDTRQQIESHNPFAFAPKIVNHETDSPAHGLEDGSRTTPSSARHKRGCNCKKSKCLKKYCECFQAGVGCSDGCRCEGCHNTFGKKADLTWRQAERWETPFHEKLDAVDALAGRAHQSSPTWKGFGDTSHLSQLSQPSPRAMVSSDGRDCSKFPSAETMWESNLQSSASYLRQHGSTMNLMPQAYGTKVLNRFNPDTAFYDMMKEDDMPEILKDRSSSTPTKTLKTSSPNKKRVSPPKLQSQELGSSSSPGLRSVRKFILPAVPSFPPLTPYSKSKDGIIQIDSDCEHSNNNQ